MENVKKIDDVNRDNPGQKIWTEFRTLPKKNKKNKNEDDSNSNKNGTEPILSYSSAAKKGLNAPPILELEQKQIPQKEGNQKPFISSIKKKKTQKLELSDFLFPDAESTSLASDVEVIKTSLPIHNSIKTGSLVNFIEDEGSKSKKNNFTQNPNAVSAERFVIRRRKEREIPKSKKFTKMKRIILKEREIHNSENLILPNSRQDIQASHDSEKNPKEQLESDQSDFTNEKEDENDQLNSFLNPTNELPINDNEKKIPPKEEIQDAIKNKEKNTENIQNSREIWNNLAKLPKPPPPTQPREYVKQELSHDLDEAVKELILRLKSLQERLKAINPMKAQSKRRLISGLREVSRAVQSRKAKCVIVAANIDEVSSPGGLDDFTKEILKTCETSQIPIVFALRRNSLGKTLMGKKVRVCVVAVLMYDGAEDNFKNVIQLASEGRKLYFKKLKEAKEEKK